MPEGALQCHWHLELTAEGVAAARKLLRAQQFTSHDSPSAQEKVLSSFWESNFTTKEYRALYVHAA